MNRFAKAAILATASFAAIAAPITAASADSWGYNRGGWNRPGWGGPDRYYDRRPDWNRPRHRGHGDAIAAGVIGLAAGAIIAGALAQPQRPTYYAPQPRVIYEQQAPVYYRQAPARVTYQSSAGFEPWTRPWFNYCSQRYRSFNSQTGTYRGFDGADHFCTAN